MTRVLSGAALLIFAIAIVWFAPPILFLAVAELLLVAAFVELAQLAAASGLAIPRVVAGTAAALTSLGLTSAPLGGLAPGTPALDAAIMTAFVALASLTLMRWRGGPDALGLAAASMFPSLYLGLPIGAMISVRASRGGREALFLLMLTIVASDTAQYYTGRAAGRRPLAPAISPKKTLEGAAGGFVLGALTMAVAGGWWLPNVAAPFRALLGVAVVALGIAGDLFESMLKRSAGVKDSSSLIPGHGGILDRIDALLFAAPVYYIVLKYV